MSVSILLVVIVGYLGGMYLWMTKIMSEYCRELVNRLEQIVKVNWDEDKEGQYVFQKECTYCSNAFWKYLIENSEQISPVSLLRELRVINNDLTGKEALYPWNFIKHFKQLTFCEKKVKRWEKELKELHYFDNVPSYETTN